MRVIIIIYRKINVCLPRNTQNILNNVNLEVTVNISKVSNNVYIEIFLEVT